MASTGDAHKFSNISATTDPFTLVTGGNYFMTGVASVWGSAKLEVLAADGSTYVPVHLYWGNTNGFVANGADEALLPPGTYKFVLSGASGVYLSICRAGG